jgi:putative pyruvate formate lyase activating enzyme
MDILDIKQPGYIKLYHTGELERRVKILETRLESCDICPHRCGVNRIKGQKGFCRSGFKPVVASCCAHHGEEPALSGERGSGTIFFGNCNMRCVYCQNYQISQKLQVQEEMEFRDLAGQMLYLQDELGCHNINLVSPSHFVPQILRAVLEAIPQGLRVPLVYNTGGYDALETIQMLEGIVDIYLPDLRYASDTMAEKYSGVRNYVYHNRRAIKEMYRQVGNLQVDENEIAYRGVIVRHLILPFGISGSRESLTWLAQEVSPAVTVSIMSQYYPCYLAPGIPELSRTISYAEYKEVVDLVHELGLENGWLQEMDAPEHYLPDFTRQGHPFEPEKEKGPD